MVWIHFTLGFIHLVSVSESLVVETNSKAGEDDGSPVTYRATEFGTRGAQSRAMIRTLLVLCLTLGACARTHYISAHTASAIAASDQVKDVEFDGNNRVSSVTIKSRGKGAFLGLAYGGLGGAAAGVGMALTGDGASDTRTTAMSALLFGASGALSGLAIGMLVGATEHYSVDHEHLRIVVAPTHGGGMGGLGFSF